MTEQEVKLRGYLIQVAIMEIPLMKLLAALMIICHDQIPNDATIGGLLNFYINKIDNISEKALDDSQENYDKVYDELVAIINNDVDPVIEAEAAKETAETATVQVIEPVKKEGE